MVYLVQTAFIYVPLGQQPPYRTMKQTCARLLPPNTCLTRIKHFIGCLLLLPHDRLSSLLSHLLRAGHAGLGRQQPHHFCYLAHLTFPAADTCLPIRRACSCLLRRCCILPAQRRRSPPRTPPHYLQHFISLPTHISASLFPYPAATSPLPASAGPLPDVVGFCLCSATTSATCQNNSGLEPHTIAHDPTTRLPFAAGVAIRIAYACLYIRCILANAF